MSKNNLVLYLLESESDKNIHKQIVKRVCHSIDPGLVLKKNNEGKPYFVDSNVKISISHCESILGVLISGDLSVGLDIESVGPIDDYVLFDLFDHDEIKYLQHFTSDVFSKEFTKMWTIKESLFKITGKWDSVVEIVTKKSKNYSFYSFEYLNSIISVVFPRDKFLTLAVKKSIEKGSVKILRI